MFQFGLQLLTSPACPVGVSSGLRERLQQHRQMRKDMEHIRQWFCGWWRMVCECARVCGHAEDTEKQQQNNTHQDSYLAR